MYETEHLKVIAQTCKHHNYFAGTGTKNNPALLIRWKVQV